MEQIKYKTLQECEASINTLKSLGMTVPDWIQQQYDDLKAIEKAKEVPKDSKTPIYDTLVANYPYGVMPEEKKKCIEDTVAQLLEDGEHAEEPGLLLGKIQCGKTDTFEDIIGLAFDKGIDVAIVFTKGTKPLAQQTIKRMKNDYRFFKASDDLDQKSTINIYDIMDVWKNLKQAKVERGKTVIICKKQSTNLFHLIDMFNEHCPFMKQKKVLVVDDEADFASRNYRSVKLEAQIDENGNPVPQYKETEMAKISQQIDDFRKIPAYCRYLQVTATPYCLYLQPQGELNLNGHVVKPFRPRFTTLVPILSKYIGGREYFELSKNPDSMYSHLFHQVAQKCMDVLGHEDKRYINNSVSSSNVYDLTTALVYYFMGTAVRRIQMRKENKNYATSALIHVEQDKRNHEWQYKIVNRLIDDIAKAVIENERSDQRVWSAINMVYEDFLESNRKGQAEGLIFVELPSKEDVLEEVQKILNPKNKGYHVQVVNSDEKVSSLLNEETGELELDTDANIFIGGSILDRGITIKNMLCFFYGRTPRNFQQDTVLQHARMYGARSKEDMAVTRFHTTAMIHKILVRMNDLDNQLREWFLAGKDKAEPNAIFIGYDKNIKPCSPQKIKASNTLILKSQMRILPIGFWTGSNTAIHKIVQHIDNLIVKSKNYDNKGEDGFFEMNAKEVLDILQLIERTYVYDQNHHNLDRKNDLKEMMCAVEYCSDKAIDNKIYVLHRTNRNMSRVRANGSWIDAPDDGHMDLAPSRNKAQDAPVVMFIRQNGNKQKDPITGDEIGWNNAAFYWPVLLTQVELDPVMYALDTNKRQQVVVVDNSSILDGINPDEVLKLTYSGDLEEKFGKEGTDYRSLDIIKWPVETRALKGTTASKYLQRDSNGNFAYNPLVKFDEENDHGIYSRNGDVFPFLLKPYKYMLLSNGRNSEADLMLLELADKDKWLVFPEGVLDDDGELRDIDTGSILLHGDDYIMNKQMKRKLFRDETITQWVIHYPIEKVLRFKKNSLSDQFEE